MGCRSSKSGQEPVAPPKWQKTVLASGLDKDIFLGTFNGKSVVICVAKPRGVSRVENEIDCFKRIGSHPHIVKMHYSGLGNSPVYFAIEIVEPVGWDLDRLKNQYAFAGQPVPSSLMARIFHQLISALRHMHGRGLIHRDLKMSNVLVDGSYNAKLIDMGIACEVGIKSKLVAAYLAPEVCEGMTELNAIVDSWGLGVILHQAYQNDWNLLRTDQSKVGFNSDRPFTQQPMEGLVKEAMLELLQLAPGKRWSLQQLGASEWLQGSTATDVSEEWHKPSASAGDAKPRRYLRRYASSRPLPLALAVYISRKNHAHLIGRLISEVGLPRRLGITVLLINYGKNKFEKLPSAGTLIQEDSWLYFGVPQGEDEMAEAVAGLREILAPERPSLLQSSMRMLAPGPDNASDDLRTFRAMSQQEVIDSGKLVEFTVEYDCFSFPRHIGTEATVGDQPPRAENETKALNLRRIFAVNLVGILRAGKDHPDWFPGADAVVRPNDIGFIVRMPAGDGSTQPTLTDDELEAFMDEQQFTELLAKRIHDDYIAIAKQADGNDTVLLRDEPAADAAVAGEVPSSSLVTVRGGHSEFKRIAWDGPDTTVEGWAQHRDVHPAVASL